MNPRELDSIYEGFHNDETFARESLTVQNKSGALVPMEFGPAQKKLHAMIQRQRELGKPVRVLALKARAVWISTYVAARFWRDTVHRTGQHCMVLAHDDLTAANVFNYYLRFHENYRPFHGVLGIPARSSDRTDRLDYANGSWIQFHTAKTATIGRSFTLRRVHFSEFAFYGDNARILMSAVMSAMPGDPDTEAIVESTANGVGNEFHIMWQRAVAGESEWIPYFFGWHEHPEYTLALEVPAAAFEKSLSASERELRTTYNLTLEQLAWRRRKIATDLNGDEDLFRQEYPSNPEEAFLMSGRPRFSHKAIARMPVIREAMEGGLEMLDLGGQKKLLFTPRDRGELILYRKPLENREYLIGADSAEGIDVNEGKGKSDPDYAVAHVIDRDTGEQVARLRARFTPAEFGWQLYMLGIYYYWAGIVPEANGPGLAAIDALVRHGYPRDYIYHRVRKPDQDPVERADLIGFKTTQITRPQMISLLEEALRHATLLIHDPVTISELLTFVIKANGRAEHTYGCHDDTVIALALGCVGMQEMPRRKKVKLLTSARPALNNYRTRHDKTDERGERKVF
jgi:hypothetical protein